MLDLGQNLGHLLSHDHDLVRHGLDLDRVLGIDVAMAVGCAQSRRGGKNECTSSRGHARWVSEKQSGISLPRREGWVRWSAQAHWTHCRQHSVPEVSLTESSQPTVLVDGLGCVLIVDSLWHHRARDKLHTLIRS